MSRLLALPLIKFKIISDAPSVFILDLRHQDEFIKEHLPNSIFVGIDGPFDKWMQLVIPNKSSKLLLILPEGKEILAHKKLIALGYTNILGYLYGGLKIWAEEYKTQHLNSIAAETFVLSRESNKLHSIDLRKRVEYEDAHILDAQLVPLMLDLEFVQKFQANKKYYLFCGGGYRSVIAISFLKKHGISMLTNIEGGFRGIQKVLSQKNTSLL